MLRLVWLSQQACQKTLWTQFDPDSQIWVVSDRKTKFFLNRSLLEKREIVNDQVKRAKEFWKEILKTVDPEMRAVDELGSQIQARDFLFKEGKAEWTRRPRAPRKLLEACQSLAPLITNENALDVLRQFEEEFKVGSGPFLEMAYLGVQFYKTCLEKKRLPRFFLPFFLSQRDDLPVEGRQLIFDLGFEMRDGEKELIQRLARANEVTVLIPAADAEHVERAGLFSYRNFDLGLTQVQSVAAAPCQKIEPQLDLWRCSSPEAEARKAVELIAGLVESGVKPESICVTAEKISDYENILAHDLEWEGIGLQHTLKTPLSASRLFRALNARLHLILGNMSASFIEEAFLSTADYRTSLRRREERSVLKPILQEAQIPHRELRDRITALKKFKRTKAINIVEFESILIDIFSDLVDQADRVENILDAEHRNQMFLKTFGKLRSEVGDMDLEFPLWVEAWEEVVNQMRLNFEAATEQGVWAVDLVSVEETPAEYLIILGALENAARGSVVRSLNETKLSFLASLGFDLTSVMKRKTDPLTQWLFSGNRKNIVFSCSRTDSTGKTVPASPLWLKMASLHEKDLEKLDYARHTRWVDVQKTILQPATAAQVDAFKDWPAGTAEKIGALVTQELQATRKVVLPEQNARPLPMTLSASRIESYWECPFKFFSRAYLGLFDEADLEIEPSPQKRGQWLHAAAEQLLGSSRKLNEWTDEDLNILVDSLDQVQKQVSSDIWPSIRSRFVRQLKRFIQHEIQWQSLYPRAKPAEVEAALRGVMEWPQEKPEIYFAPGGPLKENDYWAEFKGSIDRIDTTATGKAIVVDYKSSASASANIPSWPKRGHFQLALYSEAVEAGLLSSGPKKVIAAQYFSLKKLSRDKGFKLNDEDMTGILPDDSSKSVVSTPARDEYFSEINTVVHGILENIRKGDFSPKPENEKLCDACSWRISCRAPHLL